MVWARMLVYITGTVDQELLLRNEYLVAENPNEERTRDEVGAFRREICWNFGARMCTPKTEIGCFKKGLAWA